MCLLKDLRNSHRKRDGFEDKRRRYSGVHLIMGKEKRTSRKVNVIEIHFAFHEI